MIGEATEVVRPRRWRLYLAPVSELLRPRAAKVGVAIIAAILLLIFVGSLVYPYAPDGITGAPFTPPTFSHPFGTDYLGRDLLSQVIWGAYPSLLVALYASFAATLIGFFAGAISGYYGRLAEVVGGSTDIIMSLPTLPLLILLGSILYAYPELIPTLLVVTLWAHVARAVRSQTLSVKKLAFVDAAKTSGLKDRQILFGVIIFEVAPIAVAYFIINLSLSLILITALQFLGVGNPNIVSWGSIMYWAQQFGFGAGAWWWVLAPGLMISSISVAFGLIGFSFEEIMNPRLRS